MNIDEIHNLCSLLNIIRVIKTRMVDKAEHVARMREMIYSYKILVSKPEGMMPLWRWGYDIKTNLRNRL
jgi:alanine-alpha-ketoisovalerate/valine-pyruvate aminotransferase